mmetsp:Transcript_45225/g.61730  ORF Transcript_45225/g.61730 Transcript_45225/m.61730 type:complete len:205 (-) Transcript_45225:240-854(-)
MVGLGSRCFELPLPLPLPLLLLGRWGKSSKRGSTTYTTSSMDTGKSALLLLLLPPPPPPVSVVASLRRARRWTERSRDAGRSPRLRNAERSSKGRSSSRASGSNTHPSRCRPALLLCHANRSRLRAIAGLSRTGDSSRSSSPISDVSRPSKASVSSSAAAAAAAFFGAVLPSPSTDSVASVEKPDTFPPLLALLFTIGENNFSP